MRDIIGYVCFKD